MEMLQGVWKQHLRPRAVVGYGVKIFLPSPPNYVTRLPGGLATCWLPRERSWERVCKRELYRLLKTSLVLTKIVANSLHFGYFHTAECHDPTSDTV